MTAKRVGGRATMNGHNQRFWCAGATPSSNRAAILSSDNSERRMTPINRNAVYTTSQEPNAINISSTSPSAKRQRHIEKKEVVVSQHTTNAWTRTTVPLVAVFRHTISTWNQTTAFSYPSTETKSAASSIRSKQ